MTIELIDLDTGATMEVHGDKTSGLQFEGKPTERALIAKSVKLCVETWKEICMPRINEVPVNVHLNVMVSLDDLNLIIEALELMAKEKTND